MMQAAVMRAMVGSAAGFGPVPVTISAGAIPVVPPYGQTSANALATTDRLLYAAKCDGSTAEDTSTFRERKDRDQPFLKVDSLPS
jgi:hypothetical protein